MSIEVIAPIGAPAKQQGDVLEKFMAKWLQKLGYQVTRNVRTTACELDLYCKHKVSNRVVYVECKAYNEKTLSANDLWAFYGKVKGKSDISEGCFVSTGELGKDAKGFIIERESQNDQEVLLFYTPERLIESLIDSQIICSPPNDLVLKELCEGEALGDWVLCLSEFGMHWTSTILRNGVPQSWVICATDSPSKIITDDSLIDALATQKFSLSQFKNWNEYKLQNESGQQLAHPIVEVEIGESWTDYRPARPEHFVGRYKDIKEAFSFIKKIKNQETDSRVLAFTGDSGIGKSSFIAKLRYEATKKAGYFIYAVDVRAASDSSYVEQAFLCNLKAAQAKGFGCKVALQLTNANHPLESESIKKFLQECKRRKQVIVFVLDQFEELYAKAELVDLFNSARKLMLSVISANSNFIISFAWKTDATIPQDHPAYYMWHGLSDHRYEIRLRQFSETDANELIRLFEVDLGQKLRPDIRSYILENSQGLPWLLKKFCIHLDARVRNGISQLDMENASFDIAALFEQDLTSLSAEELQCLKLIATNAPMDWFDAIQTASAVIIKSLQDKRLVFRKGNKLNLYWDIFQGYVLRKELPEIPFSYIPQSPSMRALLRLANSLDNDRGKTADDLSKTLGFTKKTTWNIIADLIRFGIARNVDGAYFLESHIHDHDEISILRSLRETSKRHKIVALLKQGYSVKYCSQNQLIELVRASIPPGNYGHRTLSIYAQKMKRWLDRLGFIRQSGEFLVYEDQGDVQSIPSKIRREGVFIGDTSPYIASQVLQEIINEKRLSSDVMRKSGWRNVGSLLLRLELITKKDNYLYPTNLEEPKAYIQLFNNCKQEKSIQKSMELLLQRPKISAIELGSEIAISFNRKWKNATFKRIGGALRIWASWIIDSQGANTILPPPGQKARWHADDQIMLPLEYNDSY